MFSGVRASLKCVGEELGRGDSIGTFVSRVRASLGAYGTAGTRLRSFPLSTVNSHFTLFALPEAVPAPRL